MRVHYLADRIPWFGGHSGYALLPDAMSPLARVTAVHSRTTPHRIRLGRAWSRLRSGRERPDPVYAAAELHFLARTRLARADVRHVLYGEGHHPMWEGRGRLPRSWIATLHHPPAQWREWSPAMGRHLARLQSALVLYRRDLDWFEQRLGPGRVRFVPHGVDVDFFRPAEREEGPPPRRTRLLYVGQNGRDLRMLRRVVTALSARHPELRFDFVVRRTIRDRFEDLRRLGAHPSITWHEGLSDEALRDLYRGSAAALLPFACCGASNSVVEALACGTPVVTTDVGGIPDYGGDAVYPTVEEGDDGAMVALVERYLASPAWRAEVASRCRRFAEAELSWPRVASLHLRAYRELVAR